MAIITKNEIISRIFSDKAIALVKVGPKMLPKKWGEANGNLHDALTDIIGTCDSFYAVTDKWIELSRINPDFVTANMNDNIKHLLAREIKAKAKDNDVYDIM